MNIHVHDVHHNRASLFGGKSFFYFRGGIIIMKNQSAKRINIVSLKLVKESSMLYKNRCVRSPEDGYQLLKQFLEDVDRNTLSLFVWTQRISRQPLTSVTLEA